MQLSQRTAFPPNRMTGRRCEASAAVRVMMCDLCDDVMATKPGHTMESGPMFRTLLVLIGVVVV